VDAVFVKACGKDVNRNGRARSTGGEEEEEKNANHK
jgi:hypothetical protein